MAKTIKDHKDTIEKYQSGDIQKEDSITDEQQEMQECLEKLRKENQDMVQKAMVAEDENKNMETRAR